MLDVQEHFLIRLVPVLSNADAVDYASSRAQHDQMAIMGCKAHQLNQLPARPFCAAHHLKHK